MRQRSRLPITAGRVLAGGRGARLGGSSCAPLRDALQADRRAMHRWFGSPETVEVHSAHGNALCFVDALAPCSFVLPQSA